MHIKNKERMDSFETPIGTFEKAVESSVKALDTERVETLPAVVDRVSAVSAQIIGTQPRKTLDTALIKEVRTGDVEAIRKRFTGLSPRQRLEALKEQNSDGHTALVIAAAKGNSEVIAALLEGFSPSERLEALAQTDRYGATALVTAIGNARATKTCLTGLSSSERLKAIGNRPLNMKWALSRVPRENLIETMQALIGN